MTRGRNQLRQGLCFALLGTAMAVSAQADTKGARLSCRENRGPGASFRVVCTAPDNPLHLTLTLSGTIADGALAALQSLAIAQGRAAAQTFALNGQIGMDDVAHALELVDVNFDGFDDVKVMTSSSAGPNAGYDYWLYDPKSGAYKASDIGDKLSGFEIRPDPKTKTIAASGRASCCEWETVTYKWVQGNLRVSLIVNDGLFSLADTPPLADENPQICGVEQKTYDDDERLLRVDYSLRPKDKQCAGGGSFAPSDLLALFRQKQKGYAIDAKDPNHFAIRYDSPLPGHNTP
jgi:hypothetical protein